MKTTWLTALLAVSISSLALTGCSNQQAAEQPQRTEVLLSAAASLGQPLEAIKNDFEQENPGITLTLNLAASGTLQKQIEQGAPADLFWSAGVPQMDALDHKGLLQDGTRQNATANELVLVVPNDAAANAPDSFAKLANPEVKRIAVGTPETVPAGQYAKETLTALKIWQNVEPKAIFGKDVKQVLTYVERGEADAGIVYSSDAAGSAQVKVAATASPDLHSPIVYPLAVLKHTQHPNEAKKVLNYLLAPHAQDVLAQAGFKKKEE